MFSSVGLRRFLPLLIIFALFFLPTLDTDLGWHLRYGEHFLNTGKILQENTLTYYLADYNWAHPYTLYQIATALIYRGGGLFLLSLSLSLLVVVTYIIFEKINPELTFINLAGFLAITTFGWNVFYLGWRAQVFTVVGLILTFYLLKKLQELPQRYFLLLFLLLLLFALWANFHGGFVSGLVVLAASTLNAAWQRNWVVARRLALATLTATAAVLINPYGIQNYYWVADHARVPLQNLIAEWVPPSDAIKALLLVIANIIVFFLLTRKTQQKIFWLLVVISATVLTIQARRNYPIFALVSTLALIDVFKDKLEVIEKHEIVQKGFVVLSGVALATFAIVNFPKTTRIDTDWKSYCNDGIRILPCRATEYIRAYLPQGENVYTAYEWGGFLEWQLPQYKYFVDGRMPAWTTSENKTNQNLSSTDVAGHSLREWKTNQNLSSTSYKSPYTIYLELIQAQSGYKERLDKYGTDWLFIGSGTFLDIELTNNKASPWKEIYRDEVAVIYTKK
ncbi:MAG: hypothetical protein HYU80_03070 [Candidatus Blackburnbacteria bacterium]|nr:hypothetical protein [Candidatus Blackburnbacteria bacterium]